jgi:hypothetical protein
MIQSDPVRSTDTTSPSANPDACARHASRAIMPSAKSSAKSHARYCAKLKGHAQLTGQKPDENREKTGETRLGMSQKKSPSIDGLSRIKGTNAWRIAQGFSL